jgi:uncharacterized integral membrane protein
MEDLTFVASAVMGAFILGFSMGFKWLTFKKGVESIASNN